MDRFREVVQILDDAVGGPSAVVSGPHGPFWRKLDRDGFVAFTLFGMALVTPGDGAGSTLVKALRGQPPFGADQGVAGGQIRRMPAGRAPVPDEKIAVIAGWIDDGCPGSDQPPPVPRGAVEVTVNGAPSGTGFLIASTPEHRFPATLQLRSTGAAGGEVGLRLAGSSIAAVGIDPATVVLSAQPSAVELVATGPSAYPNDTTVEVVAGGQVVASYELTVIEEPRVRFTGRFQCRLPTDPDHFDEPWGATSTMGLYAVAGPDPAHPDEPPLDRIIRFQDPVALRPFCDAVGVSVVAIEAEVNDTPIHFTSGDPLIGLPVRLGPDAVFDARDGTFAPEGFEPISGFVLHLGDVFTGATGPGVARPDPSAPPGSSAPYANGVLQLDIDATPFSPAAFGYRGRTWAERAWELVARKLARLVEQQPGDDRAARIRARRLARHTPERLDATRFPIQLYERYQGTIDRDVVTAPDAAGVLAYLAGLPGIAVAADFFDYDPDCQTGTVTATLGAAHPDPPPAGAIRSTAS